MEQFLDVERELMEQFLGRRRQPMVRPAPAPPAAPPRPRRLPMLGDIVQHVPGKEVVVRRPVDLNEDLYGLDHTLGGRHASAVDPNQHGLPFMPMAFSMEMMAEVASLLLPGKLVVGLKRLRLQRWIPFDDEPIHLEVKASVLPGEPDQVAVAIHDFGNAVRPSQSDSPAVTATVRFGDCYPEPPPVEPWAFPNARPCPLTPDDLYEGDRRLFHGPLFQAVCGTGRVADDAVEGRLVTLPHNRLFRSAPDADLLLDPLLIDASTHVLGLWHLSQPDRVGRVVLPYEMGAVEFYGPKPAVGTQLDCRVRIDRISARQVSHRIELIGPDGRYWARLIPAEYWRFYYPVEYVDYFRHKDRFLLGREGRDRVRAAVPFSLMRIDPPEDLRQPVHRAGLAHVSLTAREWQAFRTMNAPDRRRTEWIFGRLAVKDAIRSLWAEQMGERLRPADIEIETEAHGRPVARRRDGRTQPLLAISIAHTGGICFGLAAQAARAGLDAETIQPRSPGFEEIAFDDTERQLLDRFGPDRDEGIARFWCTKEALAKALGRGLAEGPRSVVVRRYDPDRQIAAVALGPLLASAFPELRLDLVRVYTYRDDNLIIGVTFLERDNP
jgi:phosphopantetheinyl transferase